MKGEDIWESHISKDVEEGYLVAFTDGSFSKEKQKYSYGVLIIDKNKNEIPLYASGKNIE